MNLNNRKDVSERTKLKILDIKVSNTDTADPFGGVMFGHLYVEGRIRLLMLVDKQDGYSVSLDDPKFPRPDYPKLCLSIGPVGSRGWGAMIIEPSIHAATGSNMAFARTSTPSIGTWQFSWSDMGEPSAII